MQGVKINDVEKLPSGTSFLNVYLKDILPLLGEKVLTSRWRCWNLDYVEDGKWYSDRDKAVKVSGAELIEFSESVGQIIDGIFEAKSEGATKHPWIKIVFFDGGWVEIWSSKSWVLEKVRERFKNVSDISNNE